MEVILSEKEILKIQCEVCKVIADSICKQYLCSSKLPEYTAIAKSQSRHLLRILKEPCTEHRLPVYTVVGLNLPAHRYECSHCMAEIEKEIER
jgi:hypothetical protein